MRLLLDEYYSPKIAEALRGRGHDVVSVKEREDLLGLADQELWERAAADRRALMTENVGDFMPLVRHAADIGERHYGVVFTSTRSMPRGAAMIGTYVERLDALLGEHAADEALAEQVKWLSAD